MSSEQEVRNVIQERIAALKAGDAHKLQQLLADEVISVNLFGFVQGKTEMLNDVKSGDVKVASMDLGEFKVQVYGNTAVATYRATVDASYRGQSRGGTNRVIAVFVNFSGAWNLVAQQVTPLRFMQRPGLPAQQPAPASVN